MARIGQHSDLTTATAATAETAAVGRLNAKATTILGGDLARGPVEQPPHERTARTHERQPLALLTPGFGVADAGIDQRDPSLRAIGNPSVSTFVIH